MLNQLPVELIILIISFLSTPNLLVLTATCRFLRSLALDYHVVRSRVGRLMPLVNEPSALVYALRRAAYSLTPTRLLLDRKVYTLGPILGLVVIRIPSGLYREPGTNVAITLTAGVLYVFEDMYHTAIRLEYPAKLLSSQCEGPHGNYPGHGEYYTVHVVDQRRLVHGYRLVRIKYQSWSIVERPVQQLPFDCSWYHTWDQQALALTEDGVLWWRDATADSYQQLVTPPVYRVITRHDNYLNLITAVGTIVHGTIHNFIDPSMVNKPALGILAKPVLEINFYQDRMNQNRATVLYADGTMIEDSDPLVPTSLRQVMPRLINGRYDIITVSIDGRMQSLRQLITLPPLKVYKLVPGVGDKLIGLLP